MGQRVMFRVVGEPATQGSHNTGRRGQVYDKNKKLAPWRDAVIAAALPLFGGRAQADPALQWLNGPLCVSVTFILPRPPSHFRKGSRSHLLASDAPASPATRPDLDKMLRATLDALKMGMAYRDDGQVVAVQADKRYAAHEDAQRPGAWICISPWPGEGASDAADS